MGRKPVTSTTYAGTAWRKGKGGRTERYHYNGKNQLVRRVAGGDAWDYTYDLQGNLVREAGPEGSGSIFMIPKTVRSVSFPAGRRSRRNGMTGKGCVLA